MRFGEYLLENSIPAWSTQYLDYNKLKSILRELKQFNCKGQNGSGSGSGSSSSSSSSSPKIDTRIPKHKGSTDSYHASPNTLSVLRPISVAIKQPFNDTQNETYLNSLRGESLINIKQINDKNVEFDLNYLIPIIQSSIETHYNDEHIQQQILKLEKKFLTKLASEMNKVSKFYCEQSVYFAKQAETLMERLRILINLKSKSKSQIETELSKHFQINNNNNNNNNNKSPSSSSDIKLNKKRQKKELQKLFRITYHAIVHKLSSYRLVNVTAIQKICKKHDKNSVFKHLKTEIEGIIDSVSNFGDNYFEQYLIERLESAYGQFLASPNHRKKCEAIQELKALGSISEKHFIKPFVAMEQKRKIQQQQNDTCKIGFYLGATTAIFVVCGLLIFIGKNTNLSEYYFPTYKVIMDSAETYRAFYGYRAIFLVCLYLWLFGCNVFIWQKYRFNHPFIFETDPSTILLATDVWLIAGFLTVFSGINGTLYLLVFMFSNLIISIRLWIFIAILFIFWIIYLIFPSKRLLSTKRYLLSSFWRQIRAPFTKVYFVDFFIADQWCSLFTVIVDLTFSTCFFVTGEFMDKTYPKKDEYKLNSICGNREVKMWIKLLRFYPYWVRFAQCIRRFYDTKKRHHLINGGKYISCIATSVIATLDESFNNDNMDISYLSLSTARLCLAIASTIYAFLWDIIKDWGLCQIDAKYILLRKELRFNPAYYYILIVINFIFRIAWGVYLFPKSFRINFDFHYIALGLGVVEISRRCIWNVFRLENEHINNCGQFRVVRDIPPLFPQITPQQQQQQEKDTDIDIDIDDDDDDDSDKET